ncbi:hypothetical protein [Chitinophaga rhizophila]|uniref:Uncharacterized protein n=1 Tax=Chitinophaga rhizophila TaxID=2866212 RepID=A0ABS7G5I9_9BACT|nr:hypothetical protein [Chitinophaga rhizophila]MBW8682897.1 hypothetical protein [Chitinophaga rhizophila]
MGLDMYHFKLTNKQEASDGDYYTVESLTSFPGILEPNRHLITDNTVPDTHFRILIFANEQDLRLYSRYGKTGTSEQLLVNNPENIATDIRNIEQQYQLDAADCLSFDRELLYKPTNEKFKHLQVTERSYTTSYKTYQVIFHTTAGYQRKGVKLLFYEDFINNAMLFKKEEVAEVLPYLDGNDPEAYRRCVENFQQHFIDNFEEGKSIFYISW